MVAELPAVVTPEHDDRVVGDTGLVEGVEHAADLRVGVTDAGVVAVAKPAGHVSRQWVARRDVEVLVEFTVGVSGKRGRAGRQLVDRGPWDRGRIVEVPILLRRHERQMRLEESDGEEEGFVLLGERGDPPYRLGGGVAVGQFVVGLVAHHGGRPLARLRPRRVGGILLDTAPYLLRGLLRPVIRVGIDGLPVGIPVRLAPRAAVLVAAMVNLVERRTVVAIGLEVLRQRDTVGQRRAEMRLEVEHPGDIGPLAGHQRRPRRAADGLLAVGVPKHDPAGREPVHVGRLGDVAAVAADVGPQVVHRNHQHVERAA